MRFHPNSLYLATGSSDNSCRLWDVQRGACIRLFLGHSDSVTAMAISPDGRTLASAGECLGIHSSSFSPVLTRTTAGLDSSIWLWDLGSSRPIKKMTGHKGPIQSLSFSAESSLLVSGSLDCTVRCWDTKSAGGERTTSRNGADGMVLANGAGTHGALPMGPSDSNWGDVDQTWVFGSEMDRR